MSDKKTIGIFHYQVGGTDGVSLEIEKWKLILEEMGHTVHLIGGDLGTAQGILVKEMFHHLPESKRLNQNTFFRLSDFDPPGYREELDRMSEAIAARFREVIQEKEIDLILAENVWCVAANPAVAPALEIVRQDGLDAGNRRGEGTEQGRVRGVRGGGLIEDTVGQTLVHSRRASLLKRRHGKGPRRDRLGLELGRSGRPDRQLRRDHTLDVVLEGHTHDRA